ncbi:hypothetical protein BGZ99_009609 [Dissophora globulifera]|uniref:Uncharacterized protein n=1 Tax=Dissophora globulifera TaxID=979702 RepID=A0A9P6ULZ5_9FUNG|nr:hypothetical protein BGZ99_009609 [Dissophora globulifera]
MLQEYQDVQLNNVVKKVRVRDGSDGRPYILLGDIIDAFCYFGERLELDGNPVPFLENEHRERQVFTLCHREAANIDTLAAYSDKVLTFVQSPAVNPALPSPSSLATPNAPPPTRNSSPYLSSQGFPSPDLKELMIAVSNLASKVDGVKSDIHSLDSRIDRVEGHVQATDLKMSEVLDSQKNVAGMQREVLNKMDVVLSRTEALLTQTFELHEYTSPRLFIVLPEVVYQGLNPALILSRYSHVKFRLYFLCECGTHTSPTGPHHLNHIHVARHEGYEITRPTEFFRKYGPHVLNLLQWLQFGAKLASGIIPPLSVISAIDLPDHFKDDLDQKVTTCIRYLTAYQNSLDFNVPGMDNGGGAMNTVNKEQLAMMAGDTGSSAVSQPTVVQVEGADLRRLGSFLKRKDQDRAYGNLFRTVDNAGHVKWICLDHYKSTYHQRQDRELENEVSLNHGEYDKRLGIITVVLASSEAISAFMGSMARAGAFNELDVHLRHYTYQDLKTLGDSLSKTNVSKLTLTCHEYREMASMGKKKLPALLKIMAAGKVCYFHFKHIKDLIPARNVTIPKELPTVRSLELTGISLKDGHETLGTILHACMNLTVLRLTDVALKPSRLSSLIKGLNSCLKLTTLSLYNCELPKECAAPIAAFLETRQSLIELDLSQNLFEDAGCCYIIEATAARLEKLSLSYAGFGDESAMALERIISGERLRCLDVSDSIEELGNEATESMVRLMDRLHSVALARMLSDPSQPCLELTTLKVELPAITLAGAQMLSNALRTDCQDAKVSLSGSKLFQQVVPAPTALATLFMGFSSRLTTLKLKDTGMNDHLALVLCETLQALEPACRLEYLDLSENRLTPAGGAGVLQSLHKNTTLKTLRMESHSFGDLGSMGLAVQLFLEANRTLVRLSVSHVSLCELTRGLIGNKADAKSGIALKAMEVQYVDGQADDILAFGDFLSSSQNTLLRLVIKHARVCDEDRSLEHLCQHLKQNQTLIELEWDYDHGYEADSYVLQRYLDRNREQWRKNVGANAQDLVLAGVDPWTARAICRGAE